MVVGIRLEAVNQGFPEAENLGRLAWGVEIGVGGGPLRRGVCVRKRNKQDVRWNGRGQRLSLGDKGELSLGEKVGLTLGAVRRAEPRLLVTA